LGVGVVAATSLSAEPLRRQAECLRVWAVASGEVVAAITAESSSVATNGSLSVASSVLVAVAAVAAQQGSTSSAVALDLEWRAASGGIDWAELSVLRAASLSLGVVATVSFGAVPLSSSADLAVVGAELSSWVVAARSTEVPAHVAEVFVVVTDLVVGAVAGSIAESVGDSWADVIVDADESGAIDTTTFAAEVDSLAGAFSIAIAGLLAALCECDGDAD